MAGTFLGISMAGWAASAVALGSVMSFAQSRHNAANMRMAHRWQQRQKQVERTANRIAAEERMYQAQQNLFAHMGASGAEMGTGTSLLRISENLKKGEEILAMIDAGAEMDADIMNFTLRSNIGRERFDRRIGLAQGVGQTLLTYGTFPS